MVLFILRFKQRFHFTLPDSDSLHAVLDASKVSDGLIFLLSAHDQELDREQESKLAAVIAQGLAADPIFLLTDLDAIPAKKQADVKKNLLKMLNKKIPVEKIHTCRTEQEGILLLRHLGSQKRKSHNVRDRRAYLLAEKIEYLGQSSVGMLKVTGYVRSQALGVNRLVHIPGLGSYQLDRIESAADIHPLDEKKQRTVGSADMDMGEADEPRILAKPDPQTQESLVSENEPDMFDGEQYLGEDEDGEGASVEMDGPFKKPSVAKKTIKVPKGTSEYQAAWIMAQQDNDYEDESDSEEEDEDEDMEEALSQEESEVEEEEDKEEYETLTVTTEGNTENYDEKNVNFAEEQETLKKLKEARTDEMFPDEIDTPLDSAARIRFQKYRGLKSFRTSPWDPKENLPADYARIFQFENFNRTKKRVLGEDILEGAEVGWYVSLYIRDVPQHLVMEFLGDSDRKKPLVVYGMLPHENKMSVLNFVVRRHGLGHQDPIKSKERLIFHCGYRRFAACPIFSQHTNGSKHKYERYWRADSTIVMTLFAPITFPPSSIIVYQETSCGRHDLVGTGSMLSADPDRLVIKRSVLSGHPFRVKKRKSVVRFMFFNREDILWFKPIELRTKYGRRGHITEPLGTHGHMKCIFDNELSQQDTVMLNLFKRVFPKWNYDPHVQDWVSNSGELMEEEGEHTIQLSQKKEPPKKSILKAMSETAMDM